MTIVNAELDGETPLIGFSPSQGDLSGLQAGAGTLGRTDLELDGRALR